MFECFIEAHKQLTKVYTQCVNELTRNHNDMLSYAQLAPVYCDCPRSICACVRKSTCVSICAWRNKKICKRELKMQISRKVCRQTIEWLCYEYSEVAGVCMCSIIQVSCDKYQSARDGGCREWRKLGAGSPSWSTRNSVYCVRGCGSVAVYACGSACAYVAGTIMKEKIGQRRDKATVRDRNRPERQSNRYTKIERQKDRNTETERKLPVLRQLQL